MEDTRRILVAFLLVFVVLFLWTTLTARKRAATQPPVQTQPESAPQPTNQAQPPVPVPTPKPSRPELFDTLENRRLRIVFSSYGGTIVSVWLKDYRVELVPAESHLGGIGLLAGRDYLDLSDRDMSVCRMGSSLEYTLIPKDHPLTTEPAGEVQVVRRYQLDDGYLLHTGIRLNGANTGYLLLFRNGMALTEPNKNEDLTHVTLLAHNQKLLRLGARQIKNELQLSGRYAWAGMKTLYFLTAVRPRQTALDTVVAGSLPDRRIGWVTGVKGNRTEDQFEIYLGPLEYNLLKHYQLHAAFDFGHFLGISLKWIGLPILKFLQWIYAVLRNFGMAIVIFAVIMKAIFFPLSRMQNRQMKSMAMLQPKLDELKKRYKDDPQGLNRETMQLYRLYKVNPLSGCLPLLIQMPIFFAMYQVLRISVDLRHAPFFFWVKDLSVKDPYYVLPVLMGVFSIAQSFLTSAGQQNKALMFMMPIFITVIFLNFPSGLQLYWLIFNVLSIIESLIVQGGMKWQKKTRPAQPVTP
jgi:YidC/Oxa1 family membrane protein insertase